MKLEDITKKLNIEVLSGQDQLDAVVKGAYTSDLLSDVIANSKADDLWITMQKHQNIIAVAKLKDLAGIILVNKREPDRETLKKAEDENFPLLATKLSAFEISGKLYTLLKGK
jgi:serine kinase of HPr protein (carbohydrate metabolism regulator)